jgi:hypothetical protein
MMDMSRKSSMMPAADVKRAREGREDEKSGKLSNDKSKKKPKSR